MTFFLTSLCVIFLCICTDVQCSGTHSDWLLVETNGGSAEYGKDQISFSHGPVAKQGDVGMVPHFVMRRPPLKIGEVAEAKIRPGFC